MALTPDAFERFHAAADATLRATLAAQGLTTAGADCVTVRAPSGAAVTFSPAEWDRYCCWWPADAAAEITAALAAVPPLAAS